jgi:hypothetical protein
MDNLYVFIFNLKLNDKAGYDEILDLIRSNVAESLSDYPVMDGEFAPMDGCLTFKIPTFGSVFAVTGDGFIVNQSAMLKNFKTTSSNLNAFHKSWHRKQKIKKILASVS